MDLLILEFKKMVSGVQNELSQFIVVDSRVVDALMYRQMAGLCEPFVTDFAHKWFLSSVSALMVRQPPGLRKMFVADFAHKWFLSSVDA